MLRIQLLLLTTMAAGFAADDAGEELVAVGGDGLVVGGREDSEFAGDIDFDGFSGVAGEEAGWGRARERGKERCGRKTRAGVGEMRDFR